jgi:hypothetical protein
MAKQRAKARDLVIPIPANPVRRLEAEADQELWLRTYFGDTFYEAFTQDRRDMLQSIENAALYGGDQGIAGPRGEGKTSLAMHGALNLMVRRLCDFPVVIGKSQSKSQLELRDIKDKLQQAELFIADYPEIGVPFQAVGGWSSRARMQTVGGRPTNLVLAADHIAFPTIGRDQLPDDWPNEIIPASCGQVIYCLGIDGPIRGTKFRGNRPKLAIIDDIEDREAAASDALIAKNEEIIEQDIAGLGASAERVARAMLCTIQNRKCNAFKYTDPTIKGSFRGKRYRKMIKRPDRMDLVQQYITMRQQRKASDEDAREAFRFWRDNQTLIEEGCVTSNPSSYSKKLHSDGEPLELSSIHAYFNRVADWGEKAVATEIDNDPPEEAGPQGNGLTSAVVCSRLNGLSRRQLPANTISLTAAIDLGKYRCHWVVIAWSENACGTVVDYGFEKVYETHKLMDNEASEPKIYEALVNWRHELLNTNYVDATGTIRKIDICFVDSGAFTNAAYEFCRQVKGIFRPSKGVSPYRRKTKSDEYTRAGTNLHATHLVAQDIWLYDLDTDYWKRWVHERFLTPTFDENNMLRTGSLSLYMNQEGQSHSIYAQHITAEEYVSEFKDGKGEKQYWNKKNSDNHWLDATYMAAAASEVCGVKLFVPSENKVEPRHVDANAPKPQPKAYQHGNDRFRKRPGGWVPRRR